jgi:hypothetical protein
MQPKPNIYRNSGIYQLQCQTYLCKYIGQTGRTFHTRYRENIQNIRNNKRNTGFSHHILNTGHSYGSIEDTMTILKTAKKGQYMKSLENYFIQKIKNRSP